MFPQRMRSTAMFAPPSRDRENLAALNKRKIFAQPKYKMTYQTLSYLN